MPLPVTYNFETHYRGDDFNGAKFDVFDVNDAPIDLTGCTAKMQLRRSSSDDEVLLEWSTSANNIQITVNEIFIKPRTGLAMDLESNRYNYDIQVTYPDGLVSTIVKGLFPIENDITR